MSTTTLIVLGILLWILLAVALALLLGRVIRLRDRHAPPATDSAPGSSNGHADSVSQPHHDPQRHDGE